MDRWRGRVALVTGASAGIGRAIALKLATHGITVVACARNLEKLEELASTTEEKCDGKIIPLKCDLENEDEILSMFGRIKSEFGGVDICINNAGMMNNAPLLLSETDKWRQMLNINILGLCICTRESVKQMKARKVDDGFVINICSMAGHRMMPIPSSHFYMATKFAVKALTEGVNNELRASKSKIRISQISPGITESEFFERGLGANTSANMFKSMQALQPDDVAESVIYCLSQPLHVQINDILLRPTEQKT